MIGDLDFSEERYVRLFVRDTAEWLSLSFEAQGLYGLLRRKCDRAGLIPLGSVGLKGAAAVVGHGARWRELEPALKELLDIGAVEHRGDRLVFPRFIEGEEATLTDATRKRENRAKRAEIARAEASRFGPHVSENGTREGESDRTPLPTVTPYRAVPSVPDLPVPEKKRRKREKAELNPEHRAIFERVLARLNHHRGGSGPGLQVAPELEARIREGIPEADLLLVVDGKVDLLDFEGGKYYRPSTLFGPKKFQGYLDELRAGPARSSGHRAQPASDPNDPDERWRQNYLRRQAERQAAAAREAAAREAEERTSAPGFVKQPETA